MIKPQIMYTYIHSFIVYKNCLHAEYTPFTFVVFGGQYLVKY